MPLPRKDRIRIGTRRSPLAMWQAQWAQRALAQCAALPIELVPGESSGDRIQGSLAAHGGKGLFVKELDAALLAGEIDCAVHSLKDIPGILEPGLSIAAVSQRADPHDMLFTAHGVEFHQLPRGARVGTSSPRRKWQMQHHRPDLILLDVRGNVATRLEQIQRQQMDAVVVAAAGVKRLQLPMDHAQPLPLDVVIPAIGQGTIAITVRSDDTPMYDLVRRACHDSRNAVIVAAERSLLAEMGADCYTPLAGYAEWGAGEEVRMRAFFANPRGDQQVRCQLMGGASAPEALGQSMARQLHQMMEQSHG